MENFSEGWGLPSLLRRPALSHFPPRLATDCRVSDSRTRGAVGMTMILPFQRPAFFLIHCAVGLREGSPELRGAVDMDN
eukprot:6047449-Pyramimonas_sp.AAC.1